MTNLAMHPYQNSDVPQALYRSDIAFDEGCELVLQLST